MNLSDYLFKTLKSSDNTISGNGLYLLASAMQASEAGVEGGFMFTLLFISGNRFAYSHLGSYSGVSSITFSMSENTITVNGLATWMSITVLKLA